MSDLTAAKAGIGRQDIRVLLEAFYAEVRRDPRLGPIFAAHVGTSDADWAPHLAKIEDFWANVMLRERSYDGNPMQIHGAMPEIREDDFALWLAIFDTAAADVLPPEKARVFSTVAHRIGRSLWMGLERMRNAGPPALTG